MPVSVGAAQARTLEEIVNASLEATGGREALARVESVRQTGTFSMSTTLFGDLEGSVESVVIPNQRFYERIDSDVFQQTIGWNGTTAWISINMNGMADAGETQVPSLAMQSSLHPFWNYGATGPDAPEFSQLDDVELDGRNHHVVQVSWQGIDSQVFVDADTMLVSRIQFADDVPGIGAVTADMSDYEEHGGVMWAVSHRVETQGVTIKNRITVVEVNGEVDHSIFDRP